VTLDDEIRRVIRDEVRRLVRAEALAANDGKPTDDTALRELALERAARLRKARRGGSR